MPELPPSARVLCRLFALRFDLAGASQRAKSQICARAVGRSLTGWQRAARRLRAQALLLPCRYTTSVLAGKRTHCPPPPSHQPSGGLCLSHRAPAPCLPCSWVLVGLRCVCLLHPRRLGHVVCSPHPFYHVSLSAFSMDLNLCPSLATGPFLLGHEEGVLGGAGSLPSSMASPGWLGLWMVGLVPWWGGGCLCLPSACGLASGGNRRASPAGVAEGVGCSLFSLLAPSGLAARLLAAGRLAGTVPPARPALIKPCVSRGHRCLSALQAVLRGIARPQGASGLCS